MVDIDDFNIFDLVGLGEATGLEFIFAASALLGGVLFLLWFILMTVGGVAEGVFEGLFGLEIDVLSSDASFKALTFQGVMAFMMFFGLAGLFVLKSDGSDPVAVAVGGIAGTASMYGTAKLFELFLAMQSTGNVEIEDTVGSKGQRTHDFPGNPEAVRRGSPKPRPAPVRWLPGPGGCRRWRWRRRRWTASPPATRRSSR